MNPTTNSDPILSDLQQVLRADAGPPYVERRRRRDGRPTRTLIALGVVSFVLVSVASAGVLGLFGGTPSPTQVRTQIERAGAGSPTALDPGVLSESATDLITKATEQGTVTLTATLAARAQICFGLRFSWRPDAPNIGCTDGLASGEAISSGISIPGEFGKSPAFLYGRVNLPLATHARLEFEGGQSEQLALREGFFLFEIPTAQTAPGVGPTRLVALDSTNSPIGMSSATIGLPQGAGK